MNNIKQKNQFYKCRYILVCMLLLIIATYSQLYAQTDTAIEGKDNSMVVSSSIPKEMYPGHTYTLFIRIRNTGSTIWTPDYYKLSLIKPKNITYNNPWSISELNLRAQAKRGSDVTFSFSEKTPAAPGTYKFQWQMEVNGTHFGQKTQPENIRVTGSPEANLSSMGQISEKNNSPDNSAFLMQIMPNEMTPKMFYEVSVTMQNTGKTTWSKNGDYKLSFMDSLLNVTNNNLRYTKVKLPFDIIPGHEVTFDFTVTAPNAPGSYEYRWMMKHGDKYFGQPSQTYLVTVK